MEHFSLGHDDDPRVLDSNRRDLHVMILRL
jgi:hypothetical protein